MKKGVLKGLLSQEFAKRAVEVTLGVLFAPPSALMAVAIVTDVVANGVRPIIVSETMHKAENETFKAYSFNTVHPDHPERLEWLRRHNLNDLPKLWNIIKGDMTYLPYKGSWKISSMPQPRRWKVFPDKTP